MPPFVRALIPAFAMLAIAASASVHSQQPPAAAVYCVTYIEAAPSSRAEVQSLLKQLAAASRKTAGNLRFEVLQRRDRTNQFNILEAWNDQAARDSNTASPHFASFRKALQPLLIAGYDERPHVPMVAGAPDAGARAGGGAVVAVTHVDFIPPKKDEGIAALRELAAASLKDAGNQRYELLQQASRPNHLTLVEIWQDEGALEKHETAAHTVHFRDISLPMNGALFDQRLYRLVD